MADLFDKDDPTQAASSLGGWAVTLRKRLADSTNFQSLADKYDSYTALEKIYLGRGPKPATQEEFTREDLEVLFAVATISWVAEESYRVEESDGASDESDKQGQVYVGLRRFVRPSELSNSPNDIECYLWDRSAAIAEDLRVSSTNSDCLKVLGVSLYAMEFAGLQKTPSESDIWFADYIVTIGNTSN